MMPSSSAAASRQLSGAKMRAELGAGEERLEVLAAVVGQHGDAVALAHAERAGQRARQPVGAPVEVPVAPAPPGERLDERRRLRRAARPVGGPIAEVVHRFPLCLRDCGRATLRAATGSFAPFCAPASRRAGACCAIASCACSQSDTAGQSRSWAARPVDEPDVTARRGASSSATRSRSASPAPTTRPAA